MPIAEGLQGIKPYVFARLEGKIEAAVAAGHDVISLGQADPDGEVPAPIVQALQQAATIVRNQHYPPFRGTHQLREAVAAWYARRWGVQIDPETQVLALPGAKDGLYHLNLAYLKPGNVALVPDPCFPTYDDGAHDAGAEVWRLPLLPENDFLPLLDAVPDGVLSRARILFLNYPNNPTGGVASRPFCQYAVDFCRQHNILLCYDNAYSEITFDGYRAPSILEFDGAFGVALEMITFSKAYNMAGFRLAVAVGSPAAIDALAAIESRVNSGVFAAVQAAGVAALEVVSPSAFLNEQREKYQHRRDFAVKAMRELGFALHLPRGAAYLWVPVPAGHTDESFADFLLDEAHVAVAPGTAFGLSGKDRIRITLSCPDERLRQAMQRIAAAMGATVR